MPTKQKSGLYRTKIKVGVDADGKSIFKYISGRTRRELEDARREVERKYVTGSPLDEDISFGEYVIHWFERRRVRAGEGTADTYRVLLNNHLLPTFGHRVLRSITADELQAWFDGYAGSSKSMIAKLKMLACGIFSSAYADGYTVRDVSVPLISPRHKATKERRALTPAETESVLHTISSHKHGLFLAVLYYTGLRRGEALGLQPQDIDFAAGMINVQRDVVYVRGKTQISDLKTVNAARLVPIPAPLADLLRPACAPLEPGAWLFSSGSNALSMSSFKRMWMSLMIDSGLVSDKALTPAAQRERDRGGAHLELSQLYEASITPHDLRHNYVTKLFHAKLDPVLTMWIVGHADYSTTVNIYTHLSRERFPVSPTDMDWVIDVCKHVSSIYRPYSPFFHS